MKQPEKICWQVNAGVLPYAPACALQQQLVEARKAGAIPDVLLFCEHPHTITLGRNGKKENLRASNHLLAQMNVTFHETNRGGDITYHGPGQIVGYPILDLTELRRDVRWYVQQLEEIMIRATADFKVTAARIPDRHGIWVGQPPTEEKLAALGVHLSRWVTSHGFAYNVATDLRYFDLIVPCGIAGKRATSLERVLDRAVRTDEVRPRLAAHFGEMFERDMLEVSRAELEDTLQNHHRHAHALAPRPSELLELKGSLA
ncbi:MAG: lipoyl(octanoyl) transferase LipB [Candidatus Acidiferrales bacterium]